ncbi:MAG TPA: hypothetical protein VKS79_12690 [Gemmataceae bacterium]|nr:hypothetical protein [Gemmataceae bacterium]
MSSPTFESSLPDAKPPAGHKVMSLREMMRKERKYHSRVWGIIIFGLALLLVFIFLLVVLLIDSAHPGRADLDDILAPVFFYLFILALCVAPFVVHPLRYRPAMTRCLIKHSLSPYGNPDELIDAIDLELQDRSYLRDSGMRPDRFYWQTTGHVVFTESWLLWFGWSEFRFLRLAELLWFYKRIEVRTRVWSTRDHVVSCLVCVNANGRPFLLRLFSEDYVDEALHRMVRRRPEALFGFQGEWRALAETEPPALQHLVARRRAEWEKLSRSSQVDLKEDRFDDACHFVRRVDSSSCPNGQKY